MKIRWGRLALVFVVLLVAGVVTALVAPEIDASRFRQPLSDALAKTLGRPVEFSSVRYQLYPAPGLTARDLVIPDDPEFGREPLAYVGEMQVGLGYLGMITGHMDVSSVRLVDASVNLARKEDAGWNFAALLQKIFVGVKDGSDAPQVKIRESRINFRTGTLKSGLFLNGVDVDLEPPASVGGALVWKYEASPARTDRFEQGFGRFTGRGRWTPAPGGNSQLSVDLELERSAIAELLTLVTGSDLGVKGRFTTRATLDGPIHDLKIRGSVELEDVDRPGFFGLGSHEFSMPYEGRLDLTGQSLELASTKPDGKKAGLPFNVTLAGNKMLVEPRWEAGLTLDGVPAPLVLDLARRLGARMPQGLAVEGEMTGQLKYAQAKPVEGSVTLKNANVSMADSEKVAVAEAQVTLAGTQVLLAPAAMTSVSGAEATVSGKWDVQSEAMEIDLASEKLGLNDVIAAAGRLGIDPPSPLGKSCRDGDARGSLRFERVVTQGEDAGLRAAESWSGEIELQESNCVLEGMPKPVKLHHGVLAFRKGGWGLRQAALEAGGHEWTASLARAAGRRPYHFEIAVKELEGADLDQMFEPALSRRQGFIDRTLRRQPPAPAWLRGRHAEGTLRIGRLKLGDEEFADVKALVFWDGATVEMPDLVAQWSEGKFSGRASVRLGGARQQYRLQGRLDGAHTALGQFDAEVDLAAAGLSGEISGVLSGTAQIAGRNVDLGDEKARLLNACLDYDAARAGQRLKFNCLEAQMGSDWVMGQSSGAAEGKLQLEFPAARRPIRLHLTPVPFEMAPAVR
ncbi:MAG: AsmA family protein [Acidobacteria bacterium]|nr:AsmA family protein [Acidobacteriota bacterium]